MEITVQIFSTNLSQESWIQSNPTLRSVFVYEVLPPHTCSTLLILKTGSICLGRLSGMSHRHYSWKRSYCPNRLLQSEFDWIEISLSVKHPPSGKKNLKQTYHTKYYLLKYSSIQKGQNKKLSNLFLAVVVHNKWLSTEMILFDFKKQYSHARGPSCGHGTK